MQRTNSIFAAALAISWLGTVWGGAGGAAFASPVPPPTEARPVTDTYHGVEVVDPYQWLENWENPEVKAWSEAQNAHARSVLDALPNVPEIRERLGTLMLAPRTSYAEIQQRGGKTFAIKSQPPRQQPFLVVMDEPFERTNERVLIDPEAIDPSHATTIDWYRVSPDGKLVAVSLSSAGSEAGDVSVFNAESGERLFEVVPRVHGGTAGGDLVWSDDAKGFFYTRYPRDGERSAEDMAFYTEIAYHALGTPTASDAYELGPTPPMAITSLTHEVAKAVDPMMAPQYAVALGKPLDRRPEMLRAFENDPPALKAFKNRYVLPRIAEIDLIADPWSDRTMALVQYGDGGTYAVYVRLNGSRGGALWNRVADYGDQVVQAQFAPDGGIYLLSRKGASKGVLLKLAKEGRHVREAKPFLGPLDVSMINELWSEPIVSSREHLFIECQAGGPQEIRVFTHAGEPVANGPKGEAIAASGHVVVGESLVNGVTVEASDVLFASTSYLAPAQVFAWDAKTRETKPTGLSTQLPQKLVDLSPYEVVREMATSKDGTKVPVNILRKKGLTLDGSHPTILTGYGGYGVNITPNFSLTWIAYLERGFVFAQANIRGGGEFGDDWHRQGNLKNKQNVFDDFHAAMRFLVESKHTSPDKLGIVGGSNGGLLMGAIFSQHPDACAAVVSHVGIYDMLRVELSANGVFNIPEFGTVKDESLFRAMHAYSPYHRVLRDLATSKESGSFVAYPPILFMTGANDPRVDPMQSRKMTAALQEAGRLASRLNRGGDASNPASGAAPNPVLLRTSMSSGHGSGTKLSERVEQAVDQLAFFERHLRASK
ncbi:MAG: prolyl oligopeptidase family serine peptidase [Planctomycetota bacterium]|nr:prolyl oligopeptidase family serine peptidase [Planctomycetota bacterium]